VKCVGGAILLWDKTWRCGLWVGAAVIGVASPFWALPMWSKPERATGGSSFAALRNTAKRRGDRTDSTAAAQEKIKKIIVCI